MQKYHPLSITLHWLMALLIAAVYACIELREYYPRGSDIREGLKAWHFMLGITVLLLVLVRIILRLRNVAPPVTPAPSAAQHLLAKVGHLALYVFMIGMPLAGWLILSAAGKPIPFFGFQLPALMNENREISGLIKEAHEFVGMLGYYLIGLHTAAALFHHYILKDNTVLRMIPWRARQE